MTTCQTRGRNCSDVTEVLPGSPYPMPYINPTRRMATAANFWDRLKFYARFTWRWIVLRRPEPLIYGIAVINRCNLRCLGCHVSNTGRRDMTWDELGPDAAQRVEPRDSVTCT